jgi:hypothetical protein
MSQQLHQLNITYNGAEDRLLLRARASTGAEYRVWLTRRYSGLLLKVLVDLLDQSGGVHDAASHPETVRQFREGALEKNYGTPAESAEMAPALPLGEGILAFRLNYETLKGGNWNLQLLPARGEGLNLALDRTLVYLFLTVLEQALAKTEWHVHMPDALRGTVH